MGRRKIEIKAITHERTRSTTFTKRKTGLLKKAYELSVLCSVKIAVIVFDQRPGQEEKIYEYCSGGEIPEIIHHRLNFTGPADTKRPKDFIGKASKLGEDEDDDEDDEEVAAPEITASPPRKKPRTVAPPEPRQSRSTTFTPPPTPPPGLENPQLPRPLALPFQISVTVPPNLAPSLPPPYPIAERQTPYPSQQNYNLNPNSSAELLDMLLRVASANGSLSSSGGSGFGIGQPPLASGSNWAWPIPTNSQRPEPEPSSSSTNPAHDWLGMLLDSSSSASQYPHVPPRVQPPPPPPTGWDLESFPRARYPETLDSVQDHARIKSEYNEGNLIGDDMPLLFSPL